MFDTLAAALSRAQDQIRNLVPGGTFAKTGNNRAAVRAAARHAGPHRPGWNHRNLKAHRPLCVACRADIARPYSGQLCAACYEHATLVRLGRELRVQAEHEAFRCTAPGCGKPFGSRQALAAHSRSHSTAVHRCEVCAREFGSAQALSAHGRAHKIGA